MLFFQWGVKAADNAVSLAAESRLLFESGYLPRAYYLAHMSTEESSKSILLHAMCVMRTPESEVPRVSALLRDHKKKIEFLVTYATTKSEDLRAAIGELQVSLINHINDLKNDTMYVSYKGGVVVAPEDGRLCFADSASQIDMSWSCLTEYASRTQCTILAYPFGWLSLAHEFR